MRIMAAPATKESATTAESAVSPNPYPKARRHLRGPRSATAQSRFIPVPSTVTLRTREHVMCGIPLVPVIEVIGKQDSSVRPAPASVISGSSTSLCQRLAFNFNHKGNQMFNTKFDLTTELFDLPFNLRKKVMYSMVGSANARIFNTADKMTEKLLADGYEHDTLKQLTHPELVALTSSVDDTDSFATAKILFGVATDWRNKLQDDADNETEGNLNETVKFMVGKQRMKETNVAGQARLASLGIKRTPEEKLATLRKDLETANRIAAEKTKRLGFTEFLIDRMITTEGGDYLELPEVTKEGLCTKYAEALQKAELSAIENEELGRTYAGQLTAADIVMVRDIRAKAIAQIYVARPIVDTGLPGPNAVRVKASSESKANIQREREHNRSDDEFVANYNLTAEA